MTGVQTCALPISHLVPQKFKALIVDAIPAMVREVLEAVILQEVEALTQEVVATQVVEAVTQVVEAVTQVVAIAGEEEEVVIKYMISNNGLNATMTCMIYSQNAIIFLNH